MHWREDWTTRSTHGFGWFPLRHKGQEPSQDSDYPPWVGRHSGEVSRPCTVGRMGRKLKEGPGSEASVDVVHTGRHGHLHWPDLTFLTLDRGLIHLAGLGRLPALSVHKEVCSLSQFVDCGSGRLLGPSLLSRGRILVVLLVHIGDPEDVSMLCVSSLFLL